MGSPISTPFTSLLRLVESALKTPESTAHLVQAPWVAEPRITTKKLDAALARVYAEPFYIPKDATEPARPPALLPPAESEEDREDRDLTNEDFLQPVPHSMLSLRGQAYDSTPRSLHTEPTAGRLPPDDAAR